MCGIVGIYNYKRTGQPVSLQLLEKMTRVLAHRGPDGEGVFCQGNIGLGHRRLAIIDLTQTGSQPMSDTENRCIITFNGEIYNYLSLRRDLISHGHAFAGSSDTEVILNAFKEWGLECLNKFNGIYAFGLYDFPTHRLILCRDPLGVKPLFFHDDGYTVSFASEIKALLLNPAVSRTIDRDALDSFFSFNYTPAPLTGIKGISQLLPGTCAVWSPERQKTHRFWQVRYDKNVGKISEREAVDAFRDQLITAVQRQTVADVPIGSFLSGGLDSAALAYALSQGDSSVEGLFHARFDHFGYDESQAAREIATSLNMPLSEIAINQDLGTLPVTISKHLEEPTADASAIPTYLLAKATSKKVKVVMSGDGADELLAGYETYPATLLASKLSNIPAALLLKSLGAISSLLPANDVRYSLREKLKRFTLYAGESFPRSHCSWRTIFTPALKKRLYTAEFYRQTKLCDPIGRYAESLCEAPELPDQLARALWVDMSFYLPNDMLVKVDRMSMAHGLEVRVPFLDLELVPFLINLPSSFKLQGWRVRKYLLRQLLKPVIPKWILKSPKAGFNFPIEVYMRGTWGDLLMDVMSSTRDTFSSFLNPEEVSSILAKQRSRTEDYRYELFGILMFGLWIYNLEHEWR